MTTECLARHLWSPARCPRVSVVFPGYGESFAVLKGEVDVRYIRLVDCPCGVILKNHLSCSGRPSTTPPQPASPSAAVPTPSVTGDAQSGLGESPMSTVAGNLANAEHAGDAGGQDATAHRALRPRASSSSAGLEAPPTSPRASPSRTGEGAGAGPGPSMTVPPEDRRVSTLRRQRRVEATASAASLPEVEDIRRDPPHPWHAPKRVTHTYLHRGDRCDVIEEEDVDPLTESLKKHVATVNIELQVRFVIWGM